MNTPTDTPSRRLVHIPLTDAEWLGLRRISFETGRTLGSLVADAVLHVYPLTEEASK